MWTRCADCTGMGAHENTDPLPSHTACTLAPPYELPWILHPHVPSVCSQVLSKHGIPRAPSKVTIREHLHRIAPSDLEYIYGLEAPAETGPSSRTRGRKRTADDDGGGTDDEADKHANLYEQEEYDLFHDYGKAPVGQGKLMM